MAFHSGSEPGFHAGASEGCVNSLKSCLNSCVHAHFSGERGPYLLIIFSSKKKFLSNISRFLLEYLCGC